MSKLPSKCPLCSNRNWNKPSREIKCKNCKNNFGSHKNKQVYCSKECEKDWRYHSEEMIKKRKEWYKHDYLNDKQKYITRSTSWQKDNPERYKILRKRATINFASRNGGLYNIMKKYYSKNKVKCLCRSKTLSLFYKHPELFNKICKCGSNINLEIHHEIYHTKIKEIKEDIILSKIYMLCRDCHRKIKSNKI